MNFQDLSMTAINMGMVMAMLLLLRERVARSRRRGADDMIQIMDLSKTPLNRIPFFKRKSVKNSMVLLGIIVVFLIWIGSRNLQAMAELVIIACLAGILLVYMRHVDDKKHIAVYDKGIKHKSGFVFFEGISGYDVSESDEYEDAVDVWIKIGNAPRVQLHISNTEIQAFEKLLRKKADIKG